MGCPHLKKTEMVNQADGNRAHKHLCGWSDDYLHVLAQLPPWLADWAEAGGPTFSPERDCPRCLHNKPKQPA